MAKTAKKPKVESHEFQAEVAKLLHLMVHSVYSDRDVFLRELISNAADACDKLRYEAIATPGLLEETPLLNIVITRRQGGQDADHRRQRHRHEPRTNSSTISAPSPNPAPRPSWKRRARGVNLIGQFGVGFYSAFIVASRVEVISRQAGSRRVLHLGLGGLRHVSRWSCRRRRGRAAPQSCCISRTMRWNFSRAGKSNRWCGPIPTISPIRSCWHRRQRSATPDQHGQCHLDAAQIRGHGGAAQGILRPCFGILFRPGADHPLPRRGAARIYGAALCAGRAAVRSL